MFLSKTKISLLLVLIIPVIGIFSPTITAQSNTGIRLVITDEGGDPLTGANVLLYLEGLSDLEDYCITNTDGFCEFSRLKPRTYQIQISFIGFQSIEKVIKLNDSEKYVERIELQPAIGELGVLFVEEERGFTAGGLGITRLTSEDLSRVPSLSLDGDLMAYIQNVPGVVSIGDQGGDLYIRGGTPAQNIVLVDDLPIVKPFHISNLFSAFPEPIVNNIDILAGGFDASYMSSTSAVIDVNLKSGDMSRYKGSFSTSPFISAIFAEGPLIEQKSSFLVSGRVSTFKSFTNYLGNEKDIQFYDLLARYSIRDDGFMCNVTALATDDQGSISNISNAYLSWRNTGLGARCFGFDDTFELPFEISIGHTTFENTEKNDIGTNNSSLLKQTFMRIDLQDYWFRQKFDFGIQIMAHTYQASVSNRFTFVDQTPLDRYVMIQIHIKSELDPIEHIRIIPSIGSQATYHTNFTFEPRVRVITNPFGNSSSELSLAIGKYYQVIDGFSDYRDAGTTFTIYRPGGSFAPLFSSVHRIIGWRQKVSPRVKTNLEAYYITHEGVPVPRWTPFPQVQVIPALANSESYGINFQAEYENERLYVKLGYALTSVEYKAKTSSLGSWLDQEVFSFSPTHDQPHQLSTIVNTDIGKYSLSLVWNLGSGKPYTKVFGFDLVPDVTLDSPGDTPGTARTYFSQPNADRLPYYHRLDVSIQRSFKLSEGLVFETEIGCLNAYNRNNVFYVDSNQLERVDQTPILPYIAAKISFD